MKNLWNRRTKAVKLAVDLLLILIILIGVWAYNDYPMPTIGTAYRQAQHNAMLPSGSSPELVLTQKRNEYGFYSLGVQDETAYCVSLSRHFFWRTDRFQTFPAVDGIFIVPFSDYRIHNLYDESDFAELDPALAIKAPDAASLRIVLSLEDYYPKASCETENDTSDTVWAGGTYLLTVEPEENGWFLADFDAVPRSSGYRIYDSGAFQNYFRWIEHFYRESLYMRTNDPNFSACFIITVYDETGAVIKTVTWEP